MKKLQEGYIVSVSIGIIAILLIVGGIYVYKNKNAPATVNTIKNTVESTEPSIIVLSPNGGEVYKIGDKINIRWSSSNYNLKTVATSIRNSDDQFAGLTCGVLTPNTGSCSWTIPGGFIPGKYKIRVSASDATLYPSSTDTSDNYFKIINPENSARPTISVSPTSGHVGTIVTITIAGNIPTNSVYIFHNDSKNGGYAPINGSNVVTYTIPNSMNQGTASMPTQSGQYRFDLVLPGTPATILNSTDFTIINN